MTTEQAPTHVEKNTEHVKVGDKPPDNATIMKPADNQAKIRQAQIDAMKSYRLTNDGQQSFSLKMESGALVKDSRKLGPEKGELPSTKSHEEQKKSATENTSTTKLADSSSTKGPEDFMHRLGNMAQNTLTSWNNALQSGLKQEQTAAQGVVKSGTEAFHRGQKMLEHGAGDAQHAAQNAGQGLLKAGGDALHQSQNIVNHEIHEGQKTVNGLAKQGSEALHRGQEFVNHGIHEGQKTAQSLAKQGGEALHEGQRFVNHEVQEGQKVAQNLVKQGGEALHDGQKFIGHEVQEGQKAAQGLAKQGSEALREGQKFVSNEIQEGQKFVNQEVSVAQQIAAAMKPYTNVIQQEMQESVAPIGESLQTIQHAFQGLADAANGKDPLAIIAMIPSIEGAATGSFWHSISESTVRAALNPQFYQNVGEVLGTVFIDAPKTATGEIFKSLADLSDWGTKHEHQAHLLAQSLMGDEGARTELNDWKDKNPVSAKQMVDSVGKISLMVANFHPWGFATSVATACGRMAFGNEIGTIMNRNPKDQESMDRAKEAHEALEEIIGPTVLSGLINIAGAKAGAVVKADKAATQASEDLIEHGVSAPHEVPPAPHEMPPALHEVPPAEATAAPATHEPTEAYTTPKSPPEHPTDARPTAGKTAEAPTARPSSDAATVRPSEVAPATAPPGEVAPSTKSSTETAPKPGSEGGSKPGSSDHGRENGSESSSDQSPEDASKHGAGKNHEHSKIKEALEVAHHHAHQMHKASEITAVAAKSKEVLTRAPLKSDSPREKHNADDASETKHKE